MTHARVSFLLNNAIVTELYRQGCGYSPEGYWKVKYKDTLLIELLLFLNTSLPIVNLRPILDVSSINHQDFLPFHHQFNMPLRSPADCSSEPISLRILALPLHMEPQPPLTRNWCWSCLNDFACTSSKDQKSDERILEACNKTHCVRSNTFSPCDRCMRTKSGSCVEVGFPIPWIVFHY